MIAQCVEEMSFLKFPIYPSSLVRWVRGLRRGRSSDGKCLVLLISQECILFSGEI